MIKYNYLNILKSISANRRQENEDFQFNFPQKTPLKKSGKSWCVLNGADERREE
jgi:hypothetical protein